MRNCAIIHPLHLELETAPLKSLPHDHSGQALLLFRSSLLTNSTCPTFKWGTTPDECYAQLMVNITQRPVQKLGGVVHNKFQMIS